MNTRALDENLLIELAGEAAFARGVGYVRDGLVTLSEQSEAGFAAHAQGTSRYRLMYREDGAEPHWDCTCPAAAEGRFCKHLVAASLIWLRGAETPPADSPEDDLLTSLQGQPAAQLAQWLYQAAMEDAGLARSLRLRLADDPEELKKALRDMFRVRGFLDYQHSLEFGGRLVEPLALLEELLGRDAEQCFQLTGYALERLLRIYGNADDSSGSIGDAIHEFAMLHARAAEAVRPDGASLAKALFALKRRDDWGFFPLELYWTALGESGQAAYGRRVEREYEALSPASEDARPTISRWSEEFPVVSRYEELARVRSDFDVLLSVLSRHLSSGHDFQRIVLTCRDFGHDALALQWAERGLRAHPEWPGMRVLASEELQRAGFVDEARQLLWDDFLRHPDDRSWRRLKEAAGSDWPAVRREALEEIAARERCLDDGRHDVSLRLQLLILDGNLDAARQLACKEAAHPDLLVSLARRIGQAHPKNAAELLRRAADALLPRATAANYVSIVPLIRDATALQSGDETDSWLGSIRTRYRARRKLMRLMDEAGLT